jgi:enoyl-CoA hydratase/carnithine racemase
LAIAADHAQFGLPEVKVGVYPMQVLAVLQHLIPRRRLLQLCTSRPRRSGAESTRPTLSRPCLSRSR